MLDQVGPATDTRDRLLWPVCCGGRELVVSIAPPSPSAAFDVLAAARAHEPATAESVLASLAIASRQPGVVAARGFLLRERPPVLFTLTVLIAELDGSPKADQCAAGAEVSRVALQAGRGLRIVRHYGPASADPRASRGLLMVQYLLDTGQNALALTFTTPHCEPPGPPGMRSRGPAADAFAALFDRLAAGCAVEPAAERR